MQHKGKNQPLKLLRIPAQQIFSMKANTLILLLHTDMSSMTWYCHFLETCSFKKKLQILIKGCERIRGLPNKSCLASAAQTSEVSNERFKIVAPPHRRTKGTTELKAKSATLKPKKGRTACMHKAQLYISQTDRRHTRFQKRHISGDVGKKSSSLPFLTAMERVKAWMMISKKRMLQDEPSIQKVSKYLPGPTGFNKSLPFQSASQSGRPDGSE